MTAKKLTPGSPIDAWCTKCKADRAHVVEALKPDGTASKVRCKECDGSHLYRPPKGAPTAPAPKAEGKAPAKKRGKGEPTVSDGEASKAKPYSMDREFAVGDVIQHAKFGYGRVTNVRAGGKMDVAFDGGARLLACRDWGSLLLRRSRPVRPIVDFDVGEEEGEVAPPADEAVDVGEEE